MAGQSNEVFDGGSLEAFKARQDEMDKSKWRGDYPMSSFDDSVVVHELPDMCEYPEGTIHAYRKKH